MRSICRLLQDLFGDGLLSSYAAPASKAGMYGQQRGQAGGYQQAQPQPQANFQYGQHIGYGQPTGYGQPPSGYPQLQPVGLPHGPSFSGYGVPPSGPLPSTGLAFDGPVRQRTHSDNSATGQPTNSLVSCTLRVAAPQIICSTSLVLSAKELGSIMASFDITIHHSEGLPRMSTVASVSILSSKLCLDKSVGVVGTKDPLVTLALLYR